MPLADGVWEIGDRDAEALTEVRKWFDRAKASGSCSINLWFSPNRKAIRQVASQELVYGYNVGLWSYENGLYSIASGSGDCSEVLVYIGGIPNAAS